MEKQEPSYITCEIAATLKNHLAISSKVKYKFVLWLSNSTLKYLLNRCKNKYLPDLHMSFLSSHLWENKLVVACGREQGVTANEHE